MECTITAFGTRAYSRPKTVRRIIIAMEPIYIACTAFPLGCFYYTQLFPPCQGLFPQRLKELTQQRGASLRQHAAVQRGVKAKAFLK